MRIAIPTNDRESLFARTGQAKEFAIYEIQNKSVLFIEFRENPHKHEDEKEDEHEHNHRDMVHALNDCDALVVKMAGKHLKVDFKAARKPLFKTQETQLLCVATTYAKRPEFHPEI
ncbi:MAG: hypothetical protein JW857_10315 [Bacteroidales bacterium]|nr:hypothetical protein [Bacteroidales bacterium]